MFKWEEYFNVIKVDFYRYSYGAEMTDGEETHSTGNLFGIALCCKKPLLLCFISSLFFIRTIKLNIYIYYKVSLPFTISYNKHHPYKHSNI